MKFFAVFRRKKKRETPLSISQMTDREKSSRLEDLALYNAELYHSMILKAFELDEKRNRERRVFYC